MKIFIDKDLLKLIPSMKKLLTPKNFDLILKLNNVYYNNGKKVFFIKHSTSYRNTEDIFSVKLNFNNIETIVRKECYYSLGQVLVAKIYTNTESIRGSVVEDSIKVLLKVLETSENISDILSILTSFTKNNYSLRDILNYKLNNDIFFKNKNDIEKVIRKEEEKNLKKENLINMINKLFK